MICFLSVLAKGCLDLKHCIYVGTILHGAIFMIYDFLVLEAFSKKNLSSSFYQSISLFTDYKRDARKSRSPVAPLVELLSELLARKHGKFEYSNVLSLMLKTIERIC